MQIGKGFDLPPGAEPWTNFHWFQASTKGVQIFVVLSDEAVWYTGHYVSGRMAPCSGDGCDYCATGIGSQIRYCVSVADTSTRRVGLMEFGKSNGDLLRDWMNRNQGLRGMVIEVSKHSRNVQSRTDLTYIDIPCEPWWNGLEVPDPLIALYLTWHKAGFVMSQQLRDYAAEQLSQRKRAAQEKRLIGRREW